jgi:heat shock protein HslJ
MRIVLTAALLAVAAVACGGDEATAPEGEWIAVSGVSEGAPVELVDGFAVSIGFDGDLIEGTAACNRYSGVAEVGSDGSFSASELSWTEIGCEPAVMEVERAYLVSLAGFTDYVVADEVLTLTGPDHEWVFEPSASG